MVPGPLTARPPLPRRIVWALAITALLLATVSYIDRQTLAVLSLAVTKALHMTDTEYGWLGSAFSFAYLVATPLCGWWIAKVGPRRGLVMSLVVWSAVAALHAFVPTFGALLALRIALGLAEGPGYPAASQTIHRIMEPAERPRGFAMLFMGASIGGMIAPPLATFIYNQSSWNIAFLATSAIGLLWLVPWIALTRRADVRAALEVEPAAPAGSSAGVGVLARLAVHPVMVRALVAVFAAAPVFGFGLIWGAKFLGSTFGVPQSAIGHYLWLPPLAFDLGAFGFGDLASRRARTTDSAPRALVAIAMVLAGALAFAAYTATPWQGIAVISAAMAGGGALYTLVTADVLARIPGELIPQASGVLACGQSLALIFAMPLVGWSVDRTHGYVEITIALAAWVVPGTLAWLAWTPRDYR